MGDNRSARHGLTLAELVLAMGLFALISVCLVALFLALLAAGNKTSDLTAGDIFAEKRLQVLVDGGLNRFAAPIALPLQGSYKLESADRSMTEYFYTASARLVENPGAGKVATYLLTLEVNWSSHDASGRPLVGETKTRIQRIVHVDP